VQLKLHEDFVVVTIYSKKQTFLLLFDIYWDATGLHSRTITVEHNWYVYFKNLSDMFRLSRKSLPVCITIQRSIHNMDMKYVTSGAHPFFKFTSFYFTAYVFYIGFCN
jgi:hypothetical protein